MPVEDADRLRAVSRRPRSGKTAVSLMRRHSGARPFASSDGAGCHPLGGTPDNEATQYKTAFATEWNPIATRYDLTTYQQGQL